MSQIYNKMRINVKEKITDIVTAVQNDANSRFLDVFLYDDGLPIDLTGNEVRIYMKKPDGQEIFNDGEITDAVAGRCQFELTSQALAAYGVLKVEISIWKDNTEILTTQQFHIFITQSLRSDNSIESSNEYGALVILFQNLYQSMDMMQDMIDNFGQPGAIANQYDVKTFWAISEAILQALKNSSTDAIMERLGESTDTLDSATIFGAINGVKSDVADVKSVTTGLTTTITNNGINGFKPKTVQLLSISRQSNSGSGISETLVSRNGCGVLIISSYNASSGGSNAYLTVTCDGTQYYLNQNNANKVTAPVFFFFNSSISAYGYAPFLNNSYSILTFQGTLSLFK